MIHDFALIHLENNARSREEFRIFEQNKNMIEKKIK